ncbi:hypothetical protein HKD37_19G052629 [Glycine soja]
MSDLVDMDLEIEATCRRNNVERQRKIFQERAVPILEEPCSLESSSTPEEAMELIENMATSDHAILRDGTHIPTKRSCTICGGAYESGCCIPTEDIAHEVNYMGNQPRPNFNVSNMARTTTSNKDNEELTLTINSTKTKVIEATCRRNNAERRRKALQERTIQLSVERTLLSESSSAFPADLRESKNNLLSKQLESLTETLSKLPTQLQEAQPSHSICKLEVVVFVEELMNPTVVYPKMILLKSHQEPGDPSGTENSSRGFGANTEKNPKEECKAIMTRSKREIIVEDENVLVKVRHAEIPLILGRPFMLIANCVVDMGKSNLEMSMDDQKVTFNLFDVVKNSKYQNVCSKMEKIENKTALVARAKSRYVTQYNEFRQELERCRWHKALTRQSDNHIDEALVKEFYANLVWGKLIKFNATTLNEFLETLVFLEPGERYSTYSRFCHTHLDPQELVSKLCIPGRGFMFNAEGAPWKLLRKDLTTLA